MHYGDDKIRQMSRSILPSSAHRWAREELAATRRKNRRKINSQLRMLRDMDCDDFEGDLQRYPDIQINQVRRERRGADKLAHYERWAVEVTKGLDIDDRLGYMQALLPAGVIGDHAMSHLRNLEELDPHYRLRYYWRAVRKTADERKAEAEAAYLQLYAQLQSILEAHRGHRRLNRALKAHHLASHTINRWGPQAEESWSCVDCLAGPRLLGGTHDIASFICDVYRGRRLEVPELSWPPVFWGSGHYGWSSYRPDRAGHHSEWKRALKRFLVSWYT